MVIYILYALQILPYDELFEALQIPAQNIRELEDLIIETIYTVKKPSCDSYLSKLF